MRTLAQNDGNAPRHPTVPGGSACWAMWSRPVYAVTAPRLPGRARPDIRAVYVQVVSQSWCCVAFFIVHWETPSRRCTCLARLQKQFVTQRQFFCFYLENFFGGLACGRRWHIPASTATAPTKNTHSGPKSSRSRDKIVSTWLQNGLDVAPKSSTRGAKTYRRGAKNVSQGRRNELFQRAK